MSSVGKTRVLLVGPGPPMVGGQAVQAKRLLDKLKNEEQIEVAFLPINPVFLPSLQKIKYLRTILTTLRYLVSLIGTIPKHEVIHVFSASFSSFLLAPAPAVLISKLFGKRVILNYRSGYAEEHLANWPWTAIPIFRMCAKVVAPSAFLVDVFKKFDIAAEYVSNFVETEKFIFRHRESLRPRFLSNRNFEELYNVECTIRAFALIQKEFEDATLTVAGGGPMEQDLKRLVAELDLKNVEFTGQVSQDEMVGLYDAADIYLNSPNIDNMPNSIIEAFASGLAVVTTNAGGIPYIVENERNGLMVETGDSEALATQAVRLLREPDLASRITHNAGIDSKKYTWTSVRERWVEVYTTA